METKNLAKVNNVLISVIEEKQDRLVPVRPLCEAIGVDFSAQRQKIERDEILSSTVVITTTVGADEKEREMYCIPLKYSFGWLFSIDTSRVNENSRQFVLNYKKKCYDVLYEYFSEYAEYVEIRGRAIERQLEIYQSLQKEFNEARFNMDEAKKKLNEAKSYNFETYKENKTQFRINFLDDETLNQIED